MRRGQGARSQPWAIEMASLLLHSARASRTPPANCTRCSMFLPQVNPTEVIPGLTWFNWAVEYRYGRLLDLGDPVDVAPNYQYSSVHGGTQ